MQQYKQDGNLLELRTHTRAHARAGIHAHTHKATGYKESYKNVRPTQEDFDVRREPKTTDTTGIKLI